MRKKKRLRYYLEKYGKDKVYDQNKVRRVYLIMKQFIKRRQIRMSEERLMHYIMILSML